MPMMLAQFLADVVLATASLVLLVGSIYSLSGCLSQLAASGGPTLILAGSIGLVVRSTLKTLTYWLEYDESTLRLLSWGGLAAVSLVAIGLALSEPPARRLR